MKLSEMIDNLQYLQAKYGDLRVSVETATARHYNVHVAASVNDNGDAIAVVYYYSGN